MQTGRLFINRPTFAVVSAGQIVCSGTAVISPVFYGVNSFSPKKYRREGSVVVIPVRYRNLKSLPSVTFVHGSVDSRTGAI